MRGAKLFLGAVVLWFSTVVATHAAELSERYEYFAVRGATLAEIHRDMARRGPLLGSTGQRHPGATRMQFMTRLRFHDDGSRCRVVDASVGVEARIILPRWIGHAQASERTRRSWAALEADIRRHEGQHVAIAREHAGIIERRLTRLGPAATCAGAEAAAKRETDRLLAEHDRAQARFDAREAQRLGRKLQNLARDTE